MSLPGNGWAVLDANGVEMARVLFLEMAVDIAKRYPMSCIEWRAERGGIKINEDLQALRKAWINQGYIPIYNHTWELLLLGGVDPLVSVCAPRDGQYCLALSRCRITPEGPSYLVELDDRNLADTVLISDDWYRRMQ